MKRGRWQLRGEVKTKSKGSVGGHYLLSGQNKNDAAGIKSHVEQLLFESRFLYKGLNLEVSITYYFVCNVS